MNKFFLNSLLLLFLRFYCFRLESWSLWEFLEVPNHVPLEGDALFLQKSDPMQLYKPYLFHVSALLSQIFLNC